MAVCQLGALRKQFRSNGRVKPCIEERLVRELIDDHPLIGMLWSGWLKIAPDMARCSSSHIGDSPQPTLELALEPWTRRTSDNDRWNVSIADVRRSSISRREHRLEV